MMAELIYKLLKPMAEWAKAHSQQRGGVPMTPRVGDVMTSACGDTVTVKEVAEHWVSCRRADGTGFMRSKRGFLKHYRHNNKTSGTEWPMTPQGEATKLPTGAVSAQSGGSAATCIFCDNPRL